MWKNLFGIDWQARNVCIGFSIFGYITASYASVGSLGIALYRVLYFKVSTFKQVVIMGTDDTNTNVNIFQATNWVKSVETVLLMMMISSIFGITVLLSLSTGAGRAAGSTVFNRCLGQTSSIEVKYLFLFVSLFSLLPGFIFPLTFFS